MSSNEEYCFRSAHEQALENRENANPAAARAPPARYFGHSLMYESNDDRHPDNYESNANRHLDNGKLTSKKPRIVFLTLRRNRLLAMLKKMMKT